MAAIKPKRGAVFGSRATVDAGCVWADSKSSISLVNSGPYYQSNGDSGLRDSALLCESRAHGYNEFCVTGQVKGTDLNPQWVFTVNVGQWANPGTVYQSGGTNYTVVYPLTATGTTLVVSGPVAPAVGTLTWISGTNSSQTNITSTAVAAAPNTIYTFTITSASTNAGTQYTNNGATFTVLYTISSSTAVVCSGTGAPAASGTLTLVAGTGPAGNLTFSAVTGSNPLIVIPPSAPTSVGAQSVWAPPNTWVPVAQQNLYWFTISGASVDTGSVFSNNGVTFTALAGLSSGTVLACMGSGAPSASGTLTFVSGPLGGANTGNLTFTSVMAGTVPGFGSGYGMPTGQQAPPQGLKLYLTDLQMATDGTGLAGGTNIKLADTNPCPLLFTTCTVASMGANQVVIESNSGHTWQPAVVTGSSLNQGLMFYGTGLFTGAGTFSYRVKGYFAP